MKWRSVVWALVALNLPVALAQDAILVERNVMVPMRDGVKLATFIRRPETSAKVPAILSRTPYNAAPKGNLAREAVRPGDPAARYAVVSQDTRGRYGSEGEFYPFINETKDGYDAIEWVAQQPWCDGNVFMSGGSYVAYTQLAAAMERPPHLRAIAPSVAPADLNGSTMFYGGAMRQELAEGWMIGQADKSQRMLRNEAPKDEVNRWNDEGKFDQWRWHLPLADAGPIALGGPSYARAWHDFVAAWNDPHKWDPYSGQVNVEKITVPVLLVGGWYDIFSQADLDLWEGLRAHGGSELTRKETRLLMGPWVHGIGKPTGSVDFTKAKTDVRALELKWFDHWIGRSSEPAASWPAIRYFVMRDDQWKEASQWPPPEAKPVKYYLAFDAATRQRSLSEQTPPMNSPPSTFTYDPAHPVATLGGNNLTIVNGIRDHWENSQHYDVVGFESAPLEKDLTIAGRVRVRLVASSSAPDTDFTAMLLDVTPAKSDAYRPHHANVLDGVVRARFRHSRDKEELLEPGKAVELDIDLWSTACTFKAGHRIRLDVSSSNFPRFARNLNTAEPPGHGTKLQKANNQIFHDAAHLSFVELPVVR